jgi:hypothetical protein
LLVRRHYYIEFLLLISQEECDETRN